LCRLPRDTGTAVIDVAVMHAGQLDTAFYPSLRSFYSRHQRAE
jgi:hypothetical protein